MKSIHDTEPALPPCAAQHFGPWLCHMPWLSSMVSAYRAGDLQPQAASISVVESGEEGPRVLFTLDDAGIATIVIEGQTQKHDSSFGGTSTVRTRRAVRAAIADNEVLGIMLRFDQAPGGTVAGTPQLADDVAMAAQIKPVHAHGDDMVASAAFWIASQTSRFTASRSTEVGSIGTMLIVEDTSGAAEQAGVVVHKISTGEFKGGAIPGIEITADDLVEFQREVDSINDLFIEAIATGRNMSDSQVHAVATGQVWVAMEAKGLGLIDEVETFDQAHANLAMVVAGIREGQMTSQQSRTRAALALRKG